MIDWLKNYSARRKARQLGQLGQKRHGKNEFIELIDRSRMLTVFITVLVWAVCTLVLSLPSLRATTFKLVVGQQAPQTIFARENFSYIDYPTYRAQQLQAANSEPVCFSVNAADNAGITQRLDQFFSELRQHSQDANLPVKDAAGEVFNSLPDELKDELMLIAGTPEIVLAYRQNLNAEMSQGIISTDLRKEYKVSQLIRVLDGEQRDRAPKAIEMLPTPATSAQQICKTVLQEFPLGADRQRLAVALQEITTKIIGDAGNLRLDAARTKMRRDEAKAKVKPLWLEVLKGEPLVLRDHIVNAETKDKLDAYERHLQTSISGFIIMRRVLANAAFCLLLLGFMIVNINLLRPDLTKNNRSIALLTLVLLLSVLLNYAAMELFGFFSALLNIPPKFMPDALPIALPAVVIVVILGIEPAIFATLFTAGTAALMLNAEAELIFSNLMFYATTGVAAALALRKVSNYRLYSVRTALVITVTMYFLAVFNLAFQGAITTQSLYYCAVLCVCNALGTAVAALILVFFMELVFRVSTNMSLLLQCDINHPVLKELQLKAPGTFFHCQTVATLAETAAKEIGANYLMCRVGALYHDIGKLKKPEYFTENNINTANMHEDLTPAMSAIILRSHVEDGVELARQYKLSQLVRDMIQQHHGTDIMRFFYNKALEQADGATVLASQYSYPGPLPQTREVAIVSLADSCEAASRSLAHPTMQNITVLVNNIINQRLESGQLNDAELTIADLAKVKESFIRTLTTMFHSRIAYPNKKGDNSNEAKLPLENRQTPEAK